MLRNAEKTENKLEIEKDAAASFSISFCLTDYNILKAQEEFMWITIRKHPYLKHF